METLIEEAPQLIISFLLILATVALLIARVVNVLEGLPLLFIVATYWIGNGTSRLVAKKVEQKLTAPQVDQLVNVIATTPMLPPDPPPVVPPVLRKSLLVKPVKPGDTSGTP